jgi:hypothetical protein
MMLTVLPNLKTMLHRAANNFNLLNFVQGHLKAQNLIEVPFISDENG